MHQTPHPVLFRLAPAATVHNAVAALPVLAMTALIDLLHTTAESA